MPLLHEIVRSKLCDTYLGDFSIFTEDPNKFTITITGSEQSYFKTHVHNRDNNRLIITIEPEKFGADFLRAAANATLTQKETFCTLWKSIGERYIEITINGVPVSPEMFCEHEPNWRQFKLRFSKAPFYNPDSDNRDDIIVNYIEKCMSMIFSLVSIQVEGFAEGKEKYSVSKTYERNPINKQICLTAKGYACEACGVLLENIYGPVAHHFIEVHHSITVASMNGHYIVKPLEDLHPLCPNCHAIAHRKTPPYTIAEIKEMLAANEPTSVYSNSIAAEPIHPYKQPGEN